MRASKGEALQSLGWRAFLQNQTQVAAIPFALAENLCWLIATASPSIAGYG